jgi:hypothetical protein
MTKSKKIPLEFSGVVHPNKISQHGKDWHNA